MANSAKGAIPKAILIAHLIVLAASGPVDAATPAIGSGNRHSVALHADGTVRTWGDDSSGQLGLGRTLLATAPAVVLGLANVSRVSSGQNHVVALLRDGTVWAWGINSLGQLGDGTTTNRSTPAPVAGLDGVVSISAGLGHTLALKGDGSVWSWGVNYHGELGYAESQLRPLRVPGLANADIIAIAAGGAHSLALGRDGTVWGWGENDSGQLGDGTRTELYTGRADARPVVGISGCWRRSRGPASTLHREERGCVAATSRSTNKPRESYGWGLRVSSGEATAADPRRAGHSRAPRRASEETTASGGGSNGRDNSSTADR